MHTERAGNVLSVVWEIASWEFKTKHIKSFDHQLGDHANYVPNCIAVTQWVQGVRLAS